MYSFPSLCQTKAKLINLILIILIFDPLIAVV